jgi:hypothetical protein
MAGSLIRVQQSARDHAEQAASAHLFGAPLPVATQATASIDSPYKVSGIACVGDGEHCDDQQVAVAMLSGPGGDLTVHTGSKLPTGETVIRIAPYTVVLSSDAGESDLKLAIPAASTDERTALLPLDGSNVHVAVEAAKSPEPNKVLTQNMTALQEALKAAQERRKSLKTKAKTPGGSATP